MAHTHNFQYPLRVVPGMKHGDGAQITQVLLDFQYPLRVVPGMKRSSEEAPHVQALRSFNTLCGSYQE